MRSTLNGIALGPNSPARTVRLNRPEKDEQHLGDDFVTRLEGEVISLSQTRESQVHEGLPDRRYRVFGVAFWWEWKAENGKLTRSQHVFLQREMDCFCFGGVGVFEDLEAFVRVVRSSRLANDAQLLSTHCNSLLARWVAKGYRSETRPQGRRSRR